MNFEESLDFPGILSFNYNEFIRPRGELMIKVIDKFRIKDLISKRLPTYPIANSALNWIFR